MNSHMFFTVATQRNTVLRAMKIAVVVGAILVVINEGSQLLSGELDTAGLIRVAMNFVVPYLVSTVSTVLAHAETQSNAIKNSTPSDCENTKAVLRDG